MKSRSLTAVVCLASLIGCSSTKTSSTTTPASAASTTTSGATLSTTIAIATTTPTTMSAPATTVLSTTITAPLVSTFQTLIDRYDAVVADIVADPRVAADPTDPKVLAYLALFPKDSTFTKTALTFWAEEGAKGRFYRPGPRGAISRSTVQNASPSSETEATFDVCIFQSTTIVDANGGPIESSGGVAAGRIATIKVDSQWLIRDLSRTSPDSCPLPGATP
jgi:hypothetical protein